MQVFKFLFVSIMRKYKERNVFFSGWNSDLIRECVKSEETAFHGFIYLMSVGLDIIYRLKNMSLILWQAVWICRKFYTDNCRTYSVGILIFLCCGHKNRCKS